MNVFTSTTGSDSDAEVIAGDRKLPVCISPPSSLFSAYWLPFPNTVI